MTPERLARIKAVLEQRQPDLTLVADEVHKGRNLAAMVRTADAVGMTKVHAVLPQGGYKPFRGTAMGSNRWVQVVKHKSMQSALDEVKQAGAQLVIADATVNAVDYQTLDYCKPTALIMGGEVEGVGNLALEHADHCIFIPMLGMVESYNVSVAAAIILAEVRRQRMQAGLYQGCKLDDAEFQRLFFKWGYKRLAHFCEVRKVPFPRLDEEGDIIDPDGSWRALAKSKEK